MSTTTTGHIDADKAIENVLHLARELETEAFADVRPRMVARLIRVAVADNLSAGFGPES
jgi:hypothetical protein